MGGGRNLVSVNMCGVKITPLVAVGISEHKRAIGRKKRTTGGL